MSEQQNVETITKMYDAFGRGNVQFIVDQLTDDVHWVSHFDPIVPWGGDFSGKQNVPRFFQAINDNAETTAFNPREFVAQGDTVVSTGDYAFRAKATGKSTTNPWVFIWKFRDGKVSSYEQFHAPGAADAFRK